MVRRRNKKVGEIILQCNKVDRLPTLIIKSKLATKLERARKKEINSSLSKDFLRNLLK
jgi:hypothetical protein